MTARSNQIADILRSFSWGDYGLDEVDIGLHEDFEAQEWIDALAYEIDRQLS